MANVLDPKLSEAIAYYKMTVGYIEQEVDRIMALTLLIKESIRAADKKENFYFQLQALGIVSGELCEAIYEELKSSQRFIEGVQHGQEVK